MFGDRAPKDIEPMIKGNISLVGGIQSPFTLRLEILFRRQDAADGGGNGELVPAGIERRIGQHRDPVEHDPVKQCRAGGVSAAAALIGFTLLVVEETGSGFQPCSVPG